MSNPDQTRDDSLIQWFGNQLPARKNEASVPEQTLTGIADGSITPQKRDDLIRMIISSDSAAACVKFVLEDEVDEFVDTETDEEPDYQGGDPVVENSNELKAPASLATATTQSHTANETTTSTRPTRSRQAAAVASFAAVLAVFIAVSTNNPHENPRLTDAKTAILDGNDVDGVRQLVEFLGSSAGTPAEVAEARKLLRTSGVRLGIAYSDAENFSALRDLQNQLLSSGVASEELINRTAASAITSSSVIAASDYNSLRSLGYVLSDDGTTIIQQSISKSTDGHLAAVYKTLMETLEQDPSNRAALLNYGYWLIMQNALHDDDADENGEIDLQEIGAIDLFKRLTESNKSDSAAWMGLGVAAFHGFENQLALQAFKTAEELAPNAKNLADNLNLVRLRLASPESR